MQSTNLNFSEQRREPFLDHASYRSMLDYLQNESIPRLREDIAGGRVEPRYVGHGWYDLGAKHLNAAVLLYSAGEPLTSMAPNLACAIDAFEKNVETEATATEVLDLAIQTYYVESLWLLSLATLLGVHSQIERIANIYAADETNDGADELFEVLLAKLGRKAYPADGLIHEDPYQLLLDCIKAEPPDRPTLMTKFLKRWFKAQKECDWWGSHVPRKGTTVLDTGFFGYWAFEAALVTHLWDIDDSSYRDLPHYPKDLVDYARQQAAARPVQQAPSRVSGGERCPRAGWWLTPARVGSRKYFEEGQLMPEVGGDYGATIWQWDAKQD